MIEITNTALITGQLDGTTAIPLEAYSVVQEVEMTATKTASQQYWADGPLTYTITIQNDEAVPYNDVQISDTLDITKIAFEEGSLQIGGVDVPSTDFNYEPSTGLLTVDAGDIAAGGNMVLTFRVTKV